MRFHRPIAHGVPIVALLATPWLPAARSERPPQPMANASLVVTGTVREIYRNDDGTNWNYLLVIEASSAGPGQRPEQPGPVRVPDTGDAVYVHVFERKPTAPRVPAAYGHHGLPQVGSTVRVYLYPRDDPNRWEGAYPDWFEPVAGGNNVAGGRMLGVFTAPATVGNRPGLRITQVLPNSPAARAQLEPGDILLEADGQPISNQARLVEQVNQGKPSIRFLLRNVRNGQLQYLDVAL